MVTKTLEAIAGSILNFLSNRMNLTIFQCLLYFVIGYIMGEYLTWGKMVIMFIIMFLIQFITRTKAVAFLLTGTFSKYCFSLAGALFSSLLQLLLFDSEVVYAKVIKTSSSFIQRKWFVYLQDSDSIVTF